jgi:hypothetical protein
MVKKRGISGRKCKKLSAFEHFQKLRFRKAQITLFMLIGIVITAAAFLVFFVAQSQTKDQLDTKADDMIQQLLKTTAMEEYVTLCLKEAGGKGLNILGLQGGVIYESQNGSTPEIFRQFPAGAYYLPWNIDRYDINGNKVATEEYYISYGINKPALSARSIRNPAVPWYPYPGNIAEQNTLRLSERHYAESLFHNSKPLCELNGPNMVITGVIIPCESGYYGPPKSMQEELRDYVVNGLKQCVDFESFAEAIGYNMTEGDVKANVTFGETNVIFDVYYPITFDFKGKRISKILKFRAELPVRIKRVYEYMDHLLEKEGSDLFFNISRDYENITKGKKSYWLPGFSFTLFKDACPSCVNTFGAEYDDIIVVQDEQSRIGGEPFRFYAVIENRNPVLEQILQPNPIPEKYDIVVVENMSINISPIGYDPDDDELTYTYHGWRADDIDEETGLQRETNDWQQSQSYLETGREAAIGTSRGDIGPHNVTVNVSDPEGLFDYQVVRIFVNDVPLADVQIDNMFSDIDDRYASIEDPIKLDASGTANLYGENTAYIFEDLTEEPNIKLNTQKSVVFIPDETEITAMSSAPLSILGEHKIRLTVYDNLYQASGVGIAEKNITVLPCLPHRSSDPPFPYNKNKEDPYQADHTCCLGDLNDPETWDYAPRGTLCYDDGNIKAYCSGLRGNVCGLEYT